MVACVLTAKAAAGQSGNAEKVDLLRASLERWTKNEELLAKEKRAFVQDQGILTQRIDVVKAEVASTTARIADAEKSIGEAEKTRRELEGTKSRLDAESAQFLKILLPLEAGTRALFKRLPPPIREKIERFNNQIPEPGAEVDGARLTLALRYQNVVGFLNEVNAWNRKIHTASEVRDLGDGRSAEVTVLYIGLGQGLYASATKPLAGIGTASADGWVWTPMNAAAAQIARAIAVYKSEKDAAFVPVPIKIQ